MLARPRPTATPHRPTRPARHRVRTTRTGGAAGSRPLSPTEPPASCAPRRCCSRRASTRTWCCSAPRPKPRSTARWSRQPQVKTPASPSPFPRLAAAATRSRHTSRRHRPTACPGPTTTASPTTPPAGRLTSSQPRPAASTPSPPCARAATWARRRPMLGVRRLPSAASRSGTSISARDSPTWRCPRSTATRPSSCRRRCAAACSASCTGFSTRGWAARSRSPSTTGNRADSTRCGHGKRARRASTATGPRGGPGSTHHTARPGR